MAYFDTFGLDDLIKQMDDMQSVIDRKGADAVMAGAKCAVEAMEQTVPVRTGGLKGHLVIKGPYRDMFGWYCEIYPHGTKRNGRKTERYETVGFVLEYGRSNMDATPWMRVSLEQEAEAIAKQIFDVLTFWEAGL